MHAFSRLPPRLASRSFGRLRRLLDGDETQGERGARFAFDPDRLIDQPARCPLVQHGKKIDRLAIGAAPMRILPAGPRDDVGAGIQDLATTPGEP